MKNKIFLKLLAVITSESSEDQMSDIRHKASALKTRVSILSQCFLGCNISYDDTANKQDGRLVVGMDQLFNRTMTMMSVIINELDLISNRQKLIKPNDISRLNHLLLDSKMVFIEHTKRYLDQYLDVQQDVSRIQQNRDEL